MVNGNRIIFEGLNCVGKSSLIKLLEPEFIYPYVHDTRSPFCNCSSRMDAIYGYMKAMIDIMANTNIPIWLDRFHFTEYAYGVYVHGYNELKAYRIFTEIDQALAAMENVKVVLLTDNIEDVQRRTEELRGWGNIEILSKINEGLLRASRDSSLPIFMANYRQLIDDKVEMNRLLKFMKG